MVIRKKILPVLFLLIFALPLLCTVAYLAAVEINAYQMEERLEKSSLETILVDSDQLVWVEKEKEVLINGKLFDVKSSKIINGKILLTGFFDTAEDAISKKIFALQNDSNDSSSPIFSLLAKLFCPAILQQNNSISIIDIFPGNNKFPALLCVKYINPSIGITTPPPNASL